MCVGAVTVANALAEEGVAHLVVAVAPARVSTSAVAPSSQHPPWEVEDTLPWGTMHLCWLSWRVEVEGAAVVVDDVVVAEHRHLRSVVVVGVVVDVSRSLAGAVAAVPGGIAPAVDPVVDNHRSPGDGAAFRTTIFKNILLLK